MTKFETTADGIKSTSTKVSDVEGVLVEEFLSESEQEKLVTQTDVVIEEVLETEGKLMFSDIHTLKKSDKLNANEPVIFHGIPPLRFKPPMLN